MIVKERPWVAQTTTYVPAAIQELSTAMEQTLFYHVLHVPVDTFKLYKLALGYCIAHRRRDVQMLANLQVYVSNVQMASTQILVQDQGFTKSHAQKQQSIYLIC